MAVDFEDILNFIEEERTAEGVPPGKQANRDHYRALFMECIRGVARETEFYDTSWSNASGGDLTLTTSTCALPDDCLRPYRVEWDGTDNPLEIVDEAVLDYEESGWRDATGEPTRCCFTGRQLFLNSAPTGTTTGKLVVRGFGVPADEADFVDYCPEDMHYFPCRYVLMHLPVDPKNEVAVQRRGWNRLQWLGGEGENGMRRQMMDGLRARSKRRWRY